MTEEVAWGVGPLKAKRVITWWFDDQSVTVDWVERTISINGSRDHVEVYDMDDYNNRSARKPNERSNKNAD